MARRPIVHFRLKKPPIDGVCTIYLEFLYNKRRLYYSFGQSVKITEWNEKKERVKNTNKTTKDGKYALNELLDHLEKLCVRTYLESLKDGIPQPSVLKDALQGFVDKNHHNIQKSSKPTLFALAEKFIKGEIKNKGKDKSKKNYFLANLIKIKSLPPIHRGRLLSGLSG